MTIAKIVNIIAIISSPAIAVGISLWIGEKMRYKNAQKEREHKVLENLVAFRNSTGSTEFLSALNSIIYVFHKSPRIKNLTKDLHRAFTNKENLTVINERIVELIYEICLYKKYDVTEYEIKNIFSPAQNINLKQVVSPDKQSQISSTSGFSKKHSQEIENISHSSSSITGCCLSG